MSTSSQLVTHEHSASRGNYFSRISWSAVLAGVLIAIVVQLALSILGIGIGLSTVDPLKENNPVAGLGTGTAVWYGLSSLIALFAGSWIAGRLAKTPRLFDGVIHGLLTWSLMTLLTFYLLTTTIGSIFGGIGKLVGGTMSAVGSVAGKGMEAAAPAIGDKLKDKNIDLSALKQQAETLLQQTGKPELQPKALADQADKAMNTAKASADQAGSNPQQSGNIADRLVDQLFAQGKNTASAMDKDAMVNVIMSRTGKSREEASQVADNWMATYKQAQAKWEQTKQEAEAKAREVADQAAHAASMAAIFAFISLLIGVVVAGYGAKVGTESKERNFTTDHTVTT